MNTPIQGTAADIVKLAMARIVEALPDYPWILPVLTVHDSLVFYVPEDKVLEAGRLIKALMEKQPFPNLTCRWWQKLLLAPTMGSWTNGKTETILLPPLWHYLYASGAEGILLSEVPQETRQRVRHAKTGRENPSVKVGVGSGGNQQGKKNHQFKDGRSHYREVFDRENPYQTFCEICGGSRYLVVHHIDGNRKIMLLKTL